jgi:GAF domain-containing protein
MSLLKTFADQAVIAIENVRLFTELQEKNRALTQAHAQVTEALEQQTATAEILRVISNSPTSTQPVFDAILDSATRLCAADHGILYHYDGEVFQTIACHGLTPDQETTFRSESVPPGPYSGLGRLLAGKRPVQVADLTDDIAYRQGDPRRVRFVTLLGARSGTWVPLLKNDVVVGAMAIYRREMRPFTDKQIELVQTFTDQAVVAIENVRLFKELEARNADLTDALARQTATSDILRVISSSPTDVQPVFEAIATSAVRLCDAVHGAVFRFDGDLIHVGAVASDINEAAEYLRGRYPQPLVRQSGPVAYALRHHVVLNIEDILEHDTAGAATREIARRFGHRSQLVVPLLRDGVPIGAISLTRAQTGRFSDEHVTLLQTFADQAVIAIENVRLFKELQARTQQLTRSVEQLTALREVGHAVSSSLDLETVLNTIVARAVQLAGAHSGTIWEYDAAAEEFVLRITQNVEDPELRANPNARVRRGEGAVGRLAVSQRPVQIPDITHEGAYEGRLRDSLVGAGTRALLAIPLLHEDQLLGGLVISRRTPGEFPAEVVDLLASFATQSALALQNARLFLEIEDKSRQLEAASQHKSEFLANMSHELRTPLNAIIGFSEILSDRMFGELNEKQEEYLKDIYASGTHLLSMINDILDLSKIEAGRMELELTEFDLPTAIDNALMLIRERAGRRSVALHTNIDNLLGQIQADERKVRQVVLNLLSNAIKFTPEGGRIEVGAVPRDGFVEVSVSDTGSALPRRTKKQCSRSSDRSGRRRRR